MNAKTSVFVICVAAIIYLLLYNLHDCTFMFLQTIELSTVNNNIIKLVKSQNALFFIT